MMGCYCMFLWLLHYLPVYCRKYSQKFVPEHTPLNKTERLTSESIQRREKTVQGHRELGHRNRLTKYFNVVIASTLHRNHYQ
ncbi:hypothetical protein LSTR_LSTR013837 [Laodelphax striatellus]|uniref:Secreted protein n=1 Tax=Laodelphax striatellus TaxID=195883 RepID=A0A482XRX8_LAOST|nr:hypothetical protein LSTR_LSTR013837 [Laodelphax striatellus]